ncbi:MAG: hypothetical protein QOF58_2475, partial [Pseudonocardiales bacterium]|nr:hypothetical protein [Pseudonocardiales bacterium]
MPVAPRRAATVVLTVLTEKNHYSLEVTGWGQERQLSWDQLGDLDELKAVRSQMARGMTTFKDLLDGRLDVD